MSIIFPILAFTIFCVLPAALRCKQRTWNGAILTGRTGGMTLGQQLRTKAFWLKWFGVDKFFRPRGEESQDGEGVQMEEIGLGESEEEGGHLDGFEEGKYLQ